MALFFFLNTSINIGNKIQKRNGNRRKIIVGIIIVYIKSINIVQNDEKIISNKRKSIFFLREKNRMEILGN